MAEGQSFVRFIKRINITNPGNGYSSSDAPTLFIGAPTTTIIGADTRQATATVAIASNIVDSVTITDEGLGYLTAPQVYLIGSLSAFTHTTAADTNRGAGTFTGVGSTSSGRGTGAQFTVIVDENGAVTSVTITAKGSGYAEGDTVTISDISLGGDERADDIVLTVTHISAGSGATFEVELGVYQRSPEYYHQNFSYLIDQQIPEFIRAEYPNFATFINKYFTGLDSSGNPNYVLQELLDSWNVDHYDGAFLESLLQQYAIDFPLDSSVSDRLLIKRIRDFYESKGSIEGVKTFFRLAYGEEIEIFKPSEYILRPSDGIYSREVVIKVYANETLDPKYNPLDFRGKETDIVYYTSEGSITKRNRLKTSVSRSKKIAYTNPEAFELVIDIPAETVIPGYGVEGEISCTVSGGAINSISIDNAGQGYSANPRVVILPDSGDTITTVADLQVRINSTTNQIDSVIINNGGAGYTVAPTLALVTDDVRTWIGLEDVQDENINRKAFLTRVLNKVVNKTNTGTSDGGFRIGDTFQVQETGDILGVYALDYFAEDYTLTGISNNAYIRITQIDSNSYPSSFEVIATGTGFQRASFDFILTSSNSETQTITCQTGFSHTFPGKFKNIRGFLSDANRLQDNEIYQQFSYQIKSSLSKSQWGEALTRAAHPAGMVAFSDLTIDHIINVGANYNIIPDLFVFRIFAEIETVLVQDAPALHVHKPAITDSFVIQDDEALLEPNLGKFEVPEMSENYFFDVELVKVDTTDMSENIVKDLHKPTIEDSVTFGEVVSTLLFFFRTPIDSVDFTETVLFAVELHKADTFVVDDTTSLQPNLIKSENTDLSEEQTFDITKPGVTDNPNINDSPSLGFERDGITDSAATSETGTVVSQDYGEIDYFRNDYVGEARTIS